MPFPFFAASQGAVTSCACGEGGVGGEIEEVFSKYDVNKSGTLSAADLGKAALDIYNVYLSKSHCNVLLKAADVDSSGALSLAEFTTVAEKFVASLPEIVTATAGTSYTVTLDDPLALTDAALNPTSCDAPVVLTALAAGVTPRPTAHHTAA